MIRRSTVVYITILLAVAAVYLYFNFREQPARQETTPVPTTEVSYLFSAERGAPTSILIGANSGETVELARNSKEAWTLIQPSEAAAEQGLSEAAAGQVMAMRILEKIAQIDPKMVGLREPAYILTVKFSDDTERTVHIGVVTPTESGYYIQDSAGGDVLIISKSSMDALLGLLAVPPYLETPTSSPEPSQSSTAIVTPPSTP